MNNINLTIRSIPSWQHQDYRDGRRTAGLTETFIAKCIGGRVASLEDQNNPDIIGPKGEVIEVKGKCGHSYPTPFKLTASLEARGNNGKGGTETTERRWAFTDYFALAIYKVIGDVIKVRIIFIPAEGAVMLTVPMYEFEKLWKAQTPVEMDDSTWSSTYTKTN